MSIWSKKSAALVMCAAFLHSPSNYAQAPIVDATPISQPTAPAAPTPANTGFNQGELYNQLILLQQEVMELRGIVEEQSHQLRRVKQQNRDRYIDLDRRLGELASRPLQKTQQPRRAIQSPTRKPAVMPKPIRAQAGEKAIYDAAYGLVSKKRFDEALEAFKQFLVDYPQGKYAPNSYYWMGELYQVVSPKDLDASREAFSQLLDQYPSHSKAPDAMYKLGKVYFLQGDKEKARYWLDKVIADHSNGSNSSAADKARRYINTNF